MKKNILLKTIIISLMVVLIFSSCSTNKSSNMNPENSVEITDCLGRKVLVPKNVNKVATLYAVSGHITTMLGEGEKISAVSRGLKRDIVLNMINPNIEDALMPKSGGSINMEELAKAECDVAFMDKEFSLDQNQVKQFKKFDIPFLVVDFNTIKEEQYAVEMIAEVLKKEEIALKYNNYYDKCVDRIFEKTKEIAKEDRVRIYHSVNEAARTDAKGTLPAEWTEIAGAYNVSVNEELKLVEDKYFANMEQILMWNPDVILVNEDGVDEYIIENEKWKNISAVKNNKVYKMPNGLSRWGHPTSLETPLALMWTAKTLYPELFEDVDMVKETKYFFEEFFNFEVDNELAERILDGKGMRKSKSKSD